MSALLIAQCEYLVNKYIQYLVELFDYHEPYTPLVINNFRTKLKLELDKDTFPKLISLTIFENSTDQAKQYRKIILTDKIQSALQLPLKVFIDNSGLFKIPAAGKRYLKLEDEEEEEMEPESIEETKKRKATAEIGRECKRKPQETAKNISTTHYSRTWRSSSAYYEHYQDYYYEHYYYERSR